MARRSIIDVMKDILKLLADGKERSVKEVAEQVDSQWETAIKALEFLKEVCLVRERKGHSSYKAERLFRLTEKL